MFNECLFLLTQFYRQFTDEFPIILPTRFSQRNLRFTDQFLEKQDGVAPHPAHTHTAHTHTPPRTRRPQTPSDETLSKVFNLASQTNPYYRKTNSYFKKNLDISSMQLLKLFLKKSQILYMNEQALLQRLTIIIKETNQ